MNRAEADREAWERGEHTCQRHGHSAPRDPQFTNCTVCGTDLSIPEEERCSCPHPDCPVHGESPQSVTYTEALLDGFNPYEDDYDENGEL